MADDTVPEMIERVAAALGDCYYRGNPFTLRDLMVWGLTTNGPMPATDRQWQISQLDRVLEDFAAAAISELRAQGLAIVPREATEEMIAADRAQSGTECFPLRPSEWSAAAVWAAMVKAGER